MKKIIIVLAALCFTGISFAQKDVVGALFEKYNGAEGITFVNITGDMLKLLIQAEEQRRDTVFTSKLSEVKIMALEKNSSKPVSVNFQSEVYDKLDKSLYKEMATVKQAGENINILFKENNGRISEMLIIAEGNEKALVHIKGDILFSELAAMTSNFQFKGLEHLRTLENK